MRVSNNWYHPATNGLAERFVQTMKQALRSSLGNGSLNRRLNSFLLTYRNTPYATTKVTPAFAMMKRQLRTRLDLLKPPRTKETVQSQQRAQMERRAKAKQRKFCTGENVLARNYSKGEKWVPAIVVAQTGPVSYTVQTKSDEIWRRHVDQLLSSTNTSDEPDQVETQDYIPDIGSQEPTPEDSPPELQKEPNTSGSCPSSPISGPHATPSPLARPTPEPTGRRYPSRMRRPPNRLNM